MNLNVKHESVNIFGKTSWAWQYTSVVSNNQEAEVGGLWFETGPGKNHETLSEKQTENKKGLEAWLKW
jgi:hypothetical protein